MLSLQGNKTFVLTSKICPVQKSLLTEEADGAAASNFSMNEVWENTTDQ